MSKSGHPIAPSRRRTLISRSLAAAAVVAVGAVGLTVTNSAAADTADILGADGPDVIDNRYIVVFQDQAGAQTSDIESAAADLAAEYDGSVNHVYSSVLQGFSAELDEKEAAEIAALPEVDYVEAVAELFPDTTTQPDPPNWGIDRIDQESLPLDASFTHPATAGDGVTVYVIDSGIRATHQEFGDRATVGPDFTGEDDVTDCRGHGTHVAGTVAGADYGVAKSADVVGLRVLPCEGGAAVDDIVAAIEYVADDAEGSAVVNMSLGGSNDGNNAVYEAAINASVGAGFTYVVSAGNFNGDACDQRPASFEAPITVGNSNVSDERHVRDSESGSNFGTCVDIFAPGTDIESASQENDTDVNPRTGTSMAAPHVAGAAALYLGNNPNASPAEVEAALLDNAVSDQLTDVGEGSPNLLLNTQFLTN